ncbi:hypothetical protein CU098_013810 [Rhizopus stolonifer]|uniref:Uncharacterized protein n=1 Tax=Rhizopus stolonifer TaxID=4846 RepID=A0A367KWB2_RHIST|nr:hypothetical protein CU098_013810 [Rhizopus stolonifer]
MKFFTVLAILSVAALATAAPCGHGDNNSNHEDNSKHINKENNQSIGSLSGLLGDTHILSHEETNNYVSQSAKNN